MVQAQKPIKSILKPSTIPEAAPNEQTQESEDDILKY